MATQLNSTFVRCRPTNVANFSGWALDMFCNGRAPMYHRSMLMQVLLVEELKLVISLKYKKNLSVCSRTLVMSNITTPMCYEEQ